ncbi:hypothetical protein MPLDJ20_140015 [Mesorhizobium plurifarium]|uniref:Uncharacterized protein n=1 Tax=Mesorhizobium plurifarium TaxID=69974 RepID=A0A090EPL0_MESPL|nr:hypothetical protein MPLDJ20_140015 [Mesorhizobium plurifarium]
MTFSLARRGGWRTLLASVFLLDWSRSEKLRLALIQRNPVLSVCEPGHNMDVHLQVWRTATQCPQ